MSVGGLHFNKIDNSATLSAWFRNIVTLLAWALDLANHILCLAHDEYQQKFSVSKSLE